MIKKLAGLVLILAIGCCPAMAKKGKWKVLFNGKSTDAWRGFKQDSFPDKVWKVEGGTIRTIVGGESHDIITKEKYGDFELKLEWKIAPGGNSGIIYLVSEDYDQTYQTGPEMQVLDDAKHNDGKNPKTSSPDENPVTPGPTASTAPEKSYPTMSGRLRACKNFSVPVTTL